MKRLLFFITILVLVTLINQPLISFAQSEDVKSAREEVMKSADKLTEVKEAIDLSPEEKEVEKLSAKKDVLLKVIALSTLETETVREKLETITDIPEEFVSLHASLLKNFDAFTVHFAKLKESTESAEELLLIQTIAGDLKLWRETMYDIEIKKALEFILVFQNRDILKTAGERFEKVSLHVTKVKLLQSGIAQLLLNQSKENLDEAQNFMNQAWEILRSYISQEIEGLGGLQEELIKEELKEIEDIHEESITETSVLDKSQNKQETKLEEKSDDESIIETSIKETTDSIKEGEGEIKIDIRELIRISVEKTKTAYKHFITITGMISGT
jgi:hypothetical protein